MTAEITVESFLDLLGQSDLVSDAQSLALTAEFLGEGKRPENAQTLADELVKREILTDWQAEMLLQAKHRGFRLGPYRILRPLGQGGMSKVFLAEHEMMRRRSAIKVLPSKYQEDKDLLNRFHLEARAVAALDHPNIVRAYDFNKDVRYGKEIHYLVMEYVEGSDLRRMVEEQGPLDCRKAADFVMQAAEGLAHAHAAGFVHRDIKPANLLVDPHGVLKILDLGLATLTFEAEQTLNPSEAGQTAVGTADYVSPEQVVDSRSVDGRADIYSLGLTFYFLLTGHRPFTKPTVMEVLMAHRSERPEPISKYRPDVPMDLESIIDKMAAKQPQQRYQTAKEVAEKLRKWIAEAGSARTYSRLSALMAEAARTKQPSAQETSSGASGTEATTELELAAVDDNATARSATAAKTAVEVPSENGKATMMDTKERNRPAVAKDKPLPKAKKLNAEDEHGREKTVQAVKLTEMASGETVPPRVETDLLAGLMGEDLMSELPPAEPLSAVSGGHGPLQPMAFSPAKKQGQLLQSPWFWGGVGGVVVAVVVLLLVIAIGSSPTKNPSVQPMQAVPAVPSPTNTSPAPPPAQSQASPPPSVPSPQVPAAPSPTAKVAPPPVAAPAVPAPTVEKAPTPMKSEGVVTKTTTGPPVAPPVETPPSVPDKAKTPEPAKAPTPDEAKAKPPEAETAKPEESVDTDALLAGIETITIDLTQTLDPNPKSMLTTVVMTQAKGAALQLSIKIVEKGPNVMEIALKTEIVKGMLNVLLEADLKCPVPGGKTVVVWKKSEKILAVNPARMNPPQVLRVLKTNLGKVADKFFEDFSAEVKRARAKAGAK